MKVTPGPVLVLCCFLASATVMAGESGGEASRILAVAPGTWGVISSNTLADVDPAISRELNPNYPKSAPWRGGTGQAAVVDAWNGGAFAPDLGRFGSLILFGGGHANYFGNEVYAFDVERGTWSRLTDPFVAPAAKLREFNEHGEYPDGSPMPPHTYDYIEYHPPTRSVVVLKGVQQLMVPGNPVSKGPPHVFDTVHGRWFRGASHGSALLSGGMSAFDSKRNVIWVESPGRKGSGLRYFDPAVAASTDTVGRWSQEFTKNSILADSVAAYSPQHDLIVYTRFRKGADIYAIDPAHPKRPAVVLKQTGKPPMLESAHGWEWSKERGAFLYWRRGSDVYEFYLDGDQPIRDAWVWRNISKPVSMASPQPMGRDNGIYGRFRLVRIDDREFAVVVNSIDGPVYAFGVPSRSNDRVQVEEVK